MKQNPFGLKQFRAGSCLSYLLLDRVSHQAVLLDPVLELMDDYRAYLADHRLKLTRVLETHPHRDRPSAAREICLQLDVPQGMPQASAGLPSCRIGEFEVSEIYRQGSSACFRADGLVFTGELLGIGGGSKFSELPAEISGLPGEIILQPGHEDQDLLFSTVAIEAGGAVRDTVRSSSINVQKYQPKLKDADRDTLFLDVREPEEYAQGHIPNTINLPMSELALQLDELRKARRIYVSCLSGRRSAMAAKTLSYLGIADVVNVTGGYTAWCQAGLPVVKAGRPA